MRFQSYGPLALLLAGTAAGASHPAASIEPGRPAASRLAASVLPTTLLLRVVDSASRLPLPNAEVTAAPVRRLTDARGEVRLAWPAEGTLSVRVRQIGFRYADRTLRRGGSPTATEDTVVVALARAAFALPQVVTQAQRACPPGELAASSELSISSMELLRFGAEQYNSFRATYPFMVALSRRTERRLPRSAPPRIESHGENTHSDDWGETYEPRQVVRKVGMFGFAASILFVSTLADPTFIQRHCFVARGVETQEGRRVIKVDFFPARGIRDVEWSGSAWLDSAASVLTRVDFRLANLGRDDVPRRLEGYTIFAMPSPYIAVPDSTVAWWWTLAPPRGDATQARADVLQYVTVADLAYLRSPPPPPAPSAPPGPSTPSTPSRPSRPAGSTGADAPR